MLKGSIEKMYLVKDGISRYLVEIIKTSGGGTYVAVHKDLVVKYTRGDEVKEWSYDLGKAEEVDFKSLPVDVRRAISLNLRRL